MLHLIYVALALGFVAAGFAVIVGAYKTGARWAVATIVAAILISVAANFYQHCPGWVSVGFIFLLAVLLIFFTPLKQLRFLIKPLWWLAAGYIKVSYGLGAWLTERYLLRFPIALLPDFPPDLAPPLLRGIMRVACVGLTQSIFVLAIDIYYRFALHHPLLTDTSLYGWLSLPLCVVLLVGHLGKWLYRRQEAKGLANV